MDSLIWYSICCLIINYLQLAFQCLPKNIDSSCNWASCLLRGHLRRLHYLLSWEANLLQAFCMATHQAGHSNLAARYSCFVCLPEGWINMHFGMEACLCRSPNFISRLRWLQARQVSDYRKMGKMMKRKITELQTPYIKLTFPAK